MNRAPGRLALVACLLLGGLPTTRARATDTVVYYHTDALRSVAVVTNEAGQVIERTYYAPYGAVLRRPLRDGPGYTGHREDAETGLVYMQQRYYDPETGRFLSADPVQADANGGNFNRYWYANNNPYRYMDPDGRCPVCLVMAGGALAGSVINVAAQMGAGNGSFSDRLSNVNWKQVGVAAAAGALGGGAGTIASTATTTAGMIGANVVAGAAIGAGAVHAGAAVDGKTASTSDVVKGAAIGGALSGAAGVVAAAPKAISGSASASMTQTEKVATGNLLQGIANTTRSAGGEIKIQPTGQGVANAAAATISNADNFRTQPKPEDLKRH